MICVDCTDLGSIYDLKRLQGIGMLQKSPRSSQFGESHASRRLRSLGQEHRGRTILEVRHGLFLETCQGREKVYRDRPQGRSRARNEIFSEDCGERERLSPWSSPQGSAGHGMERQEVGLGTRHKPGY